MDLAEALVLESDFVIIGGNVVVMKAAAWARRVGPRLGVAFEQDDPNSFASYRLWYLISGILENSGKLQMHSPNWYKMFMGLNARRAPS